MAVTQPLLINVAGLRGGLPALPFPLHVNDHTLTTAEDETVPALAQFVVINPDADVWIASGTGAAVVPSGDVVDGTGSILIKAGVISPVFLVQPGQVLSVVSATGTAHVAFWYYGASPV